MSAHSSPDAPTYRGKTLTPESPLPVHIPEPANIPVLEKQIDPVFNLMSTHMVPPQSAQNMTAMDQQITEQGGLTEAMDMEEANAAAAESIESVEENNGVHVSEQAEAASIEPENNEAKQEHSESSVNLEQASSLTDQPSASLAFIDDPSTTINNPQLNIPAPVSISESAEPVDARETSQNPSQAIEETTITTENEIPAAEGQDSGTEISAGGGVNYQALLDQIVPPDATPAAIDTSTGDASGEDKPTDIPTPSSANLPTQNLPVPAGLPPRPPPQEKPAIHPNYDPSEDIRSFHYPHIQNNQSNQSTQQNASLRPQQSYQPGAATGSNGLPPPPMPSFQQPTSGDGAGQVQSPTQQKNGKEKSGRNKSTREDETSKWGPEVQAIYDRFLDDEAVYTAEGTWDKFPQGSRLFVGNLPTEIVTKRDIFHIFYRYGRLAQISIKQAYGFVQFMDVQAAYDALRSEQNGKIKDRNMHLEISKPPKNSRNAQPSTAGEKLRAGHYRRSRSPDGRQGSRDAGRGDRFNRGRNSRDDGPRRRDDYRPGRSPSPRGFRGRDSYRSGRSPDRYVGGRDRSRSPFGRRYDRGQSPRRRSFDDTDSLPFRRREPRDVPEVQILVMEDLDRAFVGFLEKSFRDSGLKVAVLQMPPHVSQDAVVKRQILEGVQAIVRLHRGAQVTARVPVQLFDRSGGGNQARFENYDDLEPHIAAALIARNKQKQPPLLSQPSYASAPPTGVPYGVPGPQPSMTPQAAVPQQAQPPNLSNIFTQLDGPTLQKLMGALQNTPQTPQSAIQSALQSPSQNSDLSALLAQAQAQAQQQPQHPQAPQGFPYQQQQMSQQMPQQQPTPQQYAGYGGYPQPGQQQAMQQPMQQPMQQGNMGQAGPPQQYQYPPGGQQQASQVQDLMQQLAKYRQ